MLATLKKLYLQAARHMFGLEQASFAGGPGKLFDPMLRLLPYFSKISKIWQH
jgi:hypothetical protein